MPEPEINGNTVPTTPPRSAFVRRSTGIVFIDLPWPPSTNKVWQAHQGELHLRAEITAYRTAVGHAAMQQGVKRWEHAPQGRLEIVIMAYPPDFKRRDLDNLFKATLDALQHCGVIPDDGNIDDLRITRRSADPSGAGSLTVQIREL